MKTPNTISTHLRAVDDHRKLRAGVVQEGRGVDGVVVAGHGLVDGGVPGGAVVAVVVVGVVVGGVFSGCHVRPPPAPALPTPKTHQHTLSVILPRIPSPPLLFLRLNHSQHALLELPAVRVRVQHRGRRGIRRIGIGIRLIRSGSGQGEHVVDGRVEARDDLLPHIVGDGDGAEGPLHLHLFN